MLSLPPGTLQVSTPGRNYEGAAAPPSGSVLHGDHTGMHALSQFACLLPSSPTIGWAQAFKVASSIAAWQECCQHLLNPRDSLPALLQDQAGGCVPLYGAAESDSGHHYVPPGGHGADLDGPRARLQLATSARLVLHLSAASWVTVSSQYLLHTLMFDGTLQVMLCLMAAICMHAGARLL